MCPKCCSKLACRSQTSKFLENLAGSGCWSQGDSDLKTGLHAPLPDPATSQQVPHCRKLLCQSSQEQLPVGGITSAYRQKRGRVRTQPKFSGVFQQIVSGPQAKQQMETDSGLKQIESVPEGGKIQNGDSGNYQNIPPTRGVDYVGRFQGCLLPYPNTGPVQEIPQISCTRSDIPIQGIALRTGHSSHGVHYFSQRSETNGHAKGYKDPPVPRRLVGKGRIIHYLPPTHTDVSRNVSGTGLAREYREVGAGTKAGFQFCRLPVRPQVRPGQTNSGPMGESPRENSSSLASTGLSGPAIHVSHRPADSHGKTGSLRPPTHETHSMASQKQLESTRITGKIHSSTKVTPPTLTVVAGGEQRVTRPTTSPHKTCSASLYRRIKRRVGRSLKRIHGKGLLVGSGKQVAHKLSGTKSSLPCSKRVPKSLRRQNSSGSNRQYYSGSLHKQGRRHEVGPALCPTVENLDLVLPTSSDSKSPTHSRPSECNSGQAIQTRADHPDGMVPPSRNFSQDLQPMAPTSDRSVCHEVQPQVTSICLSSTGSLGSSSRCSHLAMGESRCIRLSTDGHVRQGGGEAPKFPLQEANSDCPGVAQHALVLGLGDHVQSGLSQPAQPVQPVDTALQSDPSQESDKSQSSCMAPRATAIKEQGFSEAVAARIEAPQRRSTRSVYEAKWAIFTKWCVINQVDFRSPPVKSVANFLLHLFEVKKLQPSTIDGYRSAIADKLGNTQVNISKDENLTRLLESFHRDRPKGRRGIPSWNLSLVLHQLTKAPFEPLREASLKHLTFKTVFLLALGSGKRRSEIHAWQHKNIRHQADWSKVSLFPSPSFLSKNQLAKEGPESVAPVVIPALAPTLDRSLKPDRSLCPIRALRYYLDRTSTIRQGKELVFVSFKKGFDKDISPATISSWIKQTVILCYELSDHHAHTLHQVKAHDVRAFAASKAFQSGVSLEQILAACHWKSHNTFTQFYLKDVAWADSELYHLGPVVAAQQIHQQAST